MTKPLFVFQRWIVLFLTFGGVLAVATAQPTPNFSSDITEGCAGASTLVNFTDESVGNPTSWLWDFGNGVTSNQRNPTTSYSRPGCYDVRLTVTNTQGSRTVTKTCHVEIFEAPRPNFTTDVSLGCPPLRVQFTDNSVASGSNIVDWFWSFSNGSFDTVRNPVVTFTQGGPVGLTLTVTDGNGCQTTQRFDAVVNLFPTPPVPAFTADQVGACESPIVVNFNNNTQAGGQNVDYLWQFPGGNPVSFSGANPPSVTYSITGNYDVTLMVSTPDGCRDTTTIPNFIGVGETRVDFEASTTTVCLGDSVVFNNTSQGALTNLFWNFGDGNTSTEATPAHVYATEGIYTVSLRASNPEGCGDSTRKNSYIRVIPKPEANFTIGDPASCTTPVDIGFTDQSVNATSWAWDFGDGGTSTAQNPTRTFNTTGRFNISLTVTGANGCTDTRTQAANISTARPQAEFEADPAEGCVPLTTTFEDLSQSIGGDIVSWQWTFEGPGASLNSSTDSMPTVTFDERRAYDVTLIVATANGCADTLTKVNYIRAGTPPDTVDFVADDSLVCVKYDPVNFSSLLPENPDTADYRFYWDFEYEPGDFSRMSEEKNPTHTYSEPDTFSVALVIDYFGCTDTLVKEDLIIVQPPQAQFAAGAELVCELPKDIILENQSVGPADVYTWFVDGALFATDSIPPPLTIDAFGPTDIMLIAENFTTGCVDTFSATVNAGSAEADFVADNTTACAPLEVNFQDLSANGIAYFWDFGVPNGFSNLPNPTFSYDSSGIYTVKLFVTDAFGCVDSLVRTDYIRVGGATVNFGAETPTGCPPLLTQFRDSSISGVPIASWNWQFGDGGTSGDQDPSHGYNIEGNYSVTLIVTDEDGCQDTLTRPNYVQVSFPTSRFEANDTVSCAGNILNFTNTSTGSNLSYQWDFGDGSSSTQANPTHAYSNPGTYTVSLITTDGNGCSDTLTRTNYILIEDLFADFDGRLVTDPNFTTNPLVAICPPMNVEFRNLSTGNIDAFQWDFGDGSTSPLQNPGYSYTQPGNFDVSLTVSHEDGCIERRVIDDFIQLGGPAGEFNIAQTGYCVGDTVVMEIISDKACNLLVDFRDGLVENRSAACQAGLLDTTIVKHPYLTPNTYSPVVLLTDAQGCTVPVEVADSLRIFDFPRAIFEPVDSVGCAPSTAAFSNLSRSQDSIFAPITRYLWDFGDGTFSTEFAPSHVFPDTGNYNIQLRIEDINGCADSTTRNFEVIQGIQADFFATDTFNCSPLNVIFTPQILNNATATAWEWEFGDNTPGDNIESPNHVYTRDGTYTVDLVISDAFGCTDTVIKEDYIFLRHPEAVASVSRDFGCIPSDITFYGGESFSDTNITSYEWCVTTLSNGFVDCNFSPPGSDSLQFVFSTPGAYEVELVVTDIFGCQDTTPAIPINIVNVARPEPIEIRGVSVAADDQVVLSFNPYQGDDFIDYAVYRFDGGTPILVGTITEQFATTFVDTMPGLDCSENVYCYKVLVKNICEEYSSIDDTEEHCTVELATGSGEDEIILTWSPYIGFEVDQYFIYRVDGNTYDLSALTNIGVVPGDVLAFTDTNTFCYDSVTYRVMATALNSADLQSFSDIAVGAPDHIPPQEGHPIGYVSVLNDDDIEISWPPYSGYKPAQFFIEKSLDGVVWDSLATFPPDVFTLVDTAVTIDAFSYFYRISVLDSCGDETPVGLLGKTILLDVGLSFNGNNPVLTWNRYIEWGQGVLNYEVEVLNESTGEFELVEVVSNLSQGYQDRRTRLNQASYCYRIKAAEAGGLGAVSYSNVSCVTFIPQVYAPTAFSPNDDGRNDDFQVFVPNLRNAELTIFNRWGKLLFRTLDLSQSWNGKFEGRTVPEGVYVYVVSGTGVDGLPFSRSGTITVIK